MGTEAQEEITGTAVTGTAQEQLADHTGTSDNDSKSKISIVIMVIIIIVLMLAGETALFLLCAALGKKERFEGDGWYGDTDVMTLTDTLSGKEAFASQGGDGGSSMAESWVYGNDMQMYSRGALLAMDEDYYYVANELDGCSLYKVSRDGSYRREKISDTPAGMISLRDDRLYFVNNFVNVSGALGIYSINIDGTQLEYMSDAVPEYLMLVNDWLYYLNENDSHIYKMNIADRREILLTDRSCVSMTMNENMIYFSYWKDPDDEDAGCVLAAMDVDGKSARELASGGYYYQVMYVDGDIYYVSYDDECFCAIGPDGSRSRVVGNADLESGLQVYDGNYYFIETSHGSAIAVYEGASGTTRYYNLQKVRNFFLFDQKLYVDYLDGTEEKISVHNLADGSLVPFFE
ncbi:MAG: DUF5050 domain-containing protein [Blautia sp.]|nr:DUF5050 domain-containing protein [Blautia sp.]